MTTSTEPNDIAASPHFVVRSVSVIVISVTDRAIVEYSGILAVHDRDAVLDVVLVDDVHLSLVHVDRAVVDRGIGRAGVDRADQATRSPASTICTGEPPLERMSARSLARSRLVQNHPAGRLRSSPAASSAAMPSAVRGPNSSKSDFGQRQLMGGGGQVRAEHIGIVGVEHRRLDLERRAAPRGDARGRCRAARRGRPGCRSSRGRLDRLGRTAAAGRRGCRGSRR